MEGTPPMSSYEDETGVKLIIIIIINMNQLIIFDIWLKYILNRNNPRNDRIVKGI